MTRLYALDANGLGHMLYHSTVVDGEGNPVSLADATRSWFAGFFASMKPTHFVACFDGPNNWRYEKDPEYKLERRTKPKDPEKIAALNALPDVWEGLGVKALRFDGFEADDVIAALASAESITDPDGEDELVIVATDKDLKALVKDEAVSQYDPKPNKAGENIYYNEAAVLEKHGVPPHRLLDLLAMAGDASDGVAGIKGVGKTYALAALQQTRSMAELWRKASEGTLKGLRPATQALISQGREQFEHARILVTLRTDVPVPSNIDDFKLGFADVDAA